MDPFGIIALVLLIAFVVAMIALPVTLIRFMNSCKPPLRTEEIPSSPEVFARFEYSPDEWSRVYQAEFVHDLKGKHLTDPLSGVIVIDTLDHELSSPHIFFHPKVIYISDGRVGKLYRVNDVNDFGYGIFLHGMELMVSNESRLSIIGESRGHVANLGPVNHRLDYTLPVPANATGEMSAIIEQYIKLRVRRS